MYFLRFAYANAVVAQLLCVKGQYGGTPNPPPNTGLLNGLMNSLQLGIKNFVDQFVPNVQLPSPINTQDVQVGELTLPTIFGSGKVKITNCPNCYNLSPEKLPGVWHLIYANDNFIKSQIFTLGKLADGYSSILFPSNQQQSIPGPPPQPNLFQPIRFPVCARLRIFDPLGADFPIEMSFLESRPNGALKSVQGIFRQVNQGSYLMAFNNGAYYIRFCPADSSIVTLEPFVPPPIVPTNQQTTQSQTTNQQTTQSQTTNQQTTSSQTTNQQTTPSETTNQQTSSTLVPPPTESTTNASATDPSINVAQKQEPNEGSNYMILSDTSSFPGCNNIAVFTTDPDYYYRNYDESVMRFVTGHNSDSSANPLHFLGCPCGLREK